MKIEGSEIGFSSQHNYVEKNSEHETLRIWGPGSQLSGGSSVSIGFALPLMDVVDISVPTTAQGAKTGSVEDPELDAVDGSKIQMLRLLIERLTGRKIKVISAKDLEPRHGADSPRAEKQSETPEAQGFAAQYNYQRVHSESEQTTFSAQGIIRTRDGKKIQFSIEMSLSRNYVEEQDLSVSIGNPPKDPLVVNFAGAAAQLSSARFVFDIDADGVGEQVPVPGPGSGLLALDRNGDGKINDGRELFGPATGNGFSELAAYDSDHNQWIDEGDPIYSGLRIWSPDSAGHDVVESLSGRGIGAIYLATSSTPFALKDAANQSLGQIKSSGIYVKEDGTPGTIQQLDVNV